MTANIFISFASQDRKVANILCTALETRGFECWISSRNIQPGENFQVSIVQAIRRARIMLLVFTENSNKSEEMTKELALASQQKLIVIPLRVEDVTPNEAFSYEFATRQWIDFFADWEFAMDQLSQRIASAIGDTPTETPALPTAPIVALEAPKMAQVPPEPIARDADPSERPKRPLLRLALVGAVVAVAVGIGLKLGVPVRAPSEPEPKEAMLAVATLLSTPSPVLPASPQDALAVPTEPLKTTAEPKRKAPKATRHVEEEIPY